MTLKTTFLVLLAFLWLITLSAQRTYDIPFRATVPSIDGIVEEDSLQDLPVFDQFTTTLPSAGKTPQSPTTAWMIHTPEGIYVAAICSSTNLRNEGSLRDQTGTGDYLTLGFDTWNDDQNAFEFTTNAFGQRVEQRATSTSTEVNFNTHWQVRTARRADGWTVEFFIPFTALRFSKGNLKDWGVQITRRDPGTGETSNWNPTDPLVRDRVLQYGTLENLVIGKTQQRLGIAVLGRVSSELNNQFIQQLYPLGAIDAQVGNGTASTFDFSIFPDRNLRYLTGHRPLYEFGRAPLAYSRQSLIEEPGLFQKNKILDQEFNINENALDPYYYPPVSGTIEQARVLNRFRYTSRTDKRVGFAISNLMMTRPIGSLKGQETRYPHQPIVNSISVEKALRNNSWVQFANRFHYLGTKELNTNLSSVATQLRDKSNRFEISGRLSAQVQHTRAVADGFLSIQKINGIFQYGLTHETKNSTRPGLLTDNRFIPSIWYNRTHTTGYFHWNNFSGGQRFWLNSTRYLRLSNYNRDINSGDSEYFLAIGHRGLNKRFQEMDASLEIIPMGQKVEIQFPDATILSNQRVWPFILHVSATSDARRRATLQTAVRVLNSTFNRGQGELKLIGRWVAHPKVVLHLGQEIDYIHSSKRVVVTRFVPDRLLEQGTLLEYQAIPSVQYTPSPTSTFRITCNYQLSSLRQRKLTEFRNKEFVNYPYDFIHDPLMEQSLLCTLEYDYNFNAASMLRLSCAYFKTNFVTPSIPMTRIIQEQLISGKRTTVNLALVWNISRNK